jgi:hypothetical protein
MASTDLTLSIDLEPTEQAKAFVRSVVVDVLRELVTEESWLSEHLQQVANKATDKALLQMERTVRFTSGTQTRMR